MTQPRYIPREALEGNRRFGRGPVPEDAWKAPAPSEDEPLDVYAVASRLQHEIATQINDLMSSTDTTTADIARIGRFSAQRWRRVLRGDVVLRLDDLAAVELATGYRIEVIVREGSEQGLAYGAARRLADRAADRQQETIFKNSRAQQRRPQQ